MCGMTRYLVLIFITLTCGCDKDNRKLYLYGTGEYNQKLSELNISFDEAKILAIKWRQANLDKTIKFAGHHCLIIDDDYLFEDERYYKSGGHRLNGVYVNGKTGSINYVKDPPPHIKCISQSLQKKRLGRKIRQSDYHPGSTIFHP